MKNVRAEKSARIFLPCRIQYITLETGEKIKRGCGQNGLLQTDVGWRCFYCGNYVYRSESSLEALWFHFKTAREYWRVTSRGGREFVNGIPVSGSPDPLPHRLLADLEETRPPKWFPYYMVYDEDQFLHYLNRQDAAGQNRLR